MNAEMLNQLDMQALRVRERILQMSTNGGCFTGASLSCTDLLVYLYRHFLRVTPDTINDANRDLLLLSKGHDVPALYGTLVENGFFPEDRLKKHLSTDDHLYWHPNVNVPGVEFHSGSLGHLLSVGLGMALDAKMRGGSNRVVVILGDGELNEGSVWETSLTASALKVDNLIAIVDRNHFQANVRTEELIPLDSIEEKFQAFGWVARSVDGHDFEQLDDAFSTWEPDNNGRPTVFVANTMRGKGVPSIEERADRWFCNFTGEEVDQLTRELHGEHQASLTSETLHVR